MGVTPVWALSLSGESRGAVYRAPGLVPWTEYGLALKLAWGVASEYRLPIHVGGVDLANGQPLWFRIGLLEPTTDPVLEPTHPITAAGSLLVFTGYVYLHRAGCYQLFARWPGGSWTVPFAAGG